MSRAFSRFAMPIVASQLVLVLGVLLLSEVETKRVQIYSTGLTEEGFRSRAGLGNTYRGFPIPWSETRGGAYYIGFNLAVPAVLLVLAVCVPILVAAERKRYREANATRVPRTNGVRALWATVIAATLATVAAHSWCDWAVPALLCVLAVCVPILLLFEWKRPWKRSTTMGARTKGIRALWVVVIAASTGIAVAFGDVMTDPKSSSWGGVGHVPFHHPPGCWLMIPSGSTTPASEPLPVDLIRIARGKLLGSADDIGNDTEIAADDWDRRTLRTLLGIGFGFVLGVSFAGRKKAGRGFNPGHAIAPLTSTPGG